MGVGQYSIHDQLLKMSLSLYHAVFIDHYVFFYYFKLDYEMHPVS